MCVVFIVTDKPPTEEELREGWKYNSDGGGFAWKEQVKGETVVKWKKGFQGDSGLEKLLKEIKKLPLPYVLHFRVASIGGKSAGLTHPFPLDPGVSTALEGSSKVGVLAHNGHWSDWLGQLKDAVYGAHGKLQIPGDGLWSDTRALAWLAGHFGRGLLHLIAPSQKVAFLLPGGCYYTNAAGWTQGNGFLASNESYVPPKSLSIVRGGKKEEVPAEVDAADAAPVQESKGRRILIERAARMMSRRLGRFRGEGGGE